MGLSNSDVTEERNELLQRPEEDEDVFEGRIFM